MPAAHLKQQVANAFLPQPPDTLGVAVSGGGDSMALLHLLHRFCALHGTTLHAVTVDHNLRPEARDEAAAVGAYCATLGIGHDVLTWEGWDGTGNLQAQARAARYHRMAIWARDRGIRDIALGHTADDQAETFLMRLSRRAGVDGLSAMPARRMCHGICWVRPLLDAGRDTLRAYLLEQRIDWVDDPSNDDMTFDRIRARRALGALADIGIDATGLSVVAEQMGQARKALDWQTFLAARDLAEIDAGAVVMDERRLRILPEEIQRRLLVRAVGWVGGSDYPPRRAAVATVMQALRKGQGATVDGCHARRVGGRIWVFREHAAVSDLSLWPGALWDRRWRVAPRRRPVDMTGLAVRALGPQGIAQCPDWRETGRPREVLMSTPAVWRGDTVIAAPLAGPHQNWHADIEGGAETFFATLLSH